ncbi:TVP38/TMEM64 family protein [Clostridium neuense]|uniref:TVP38/TMEM64 family membrane protein n=1 Tax=Clostridium neuense TaxID=1728934 RepID=A0ABW8TKC2_9CLOT
MSLKGFFNIISNKIKIIYQKIIKYKVQIGGIMLLAFFAYCAYVYYSKYFYMMKDTEKVKRFILSYGKYSMLAFLVMQIAQVIVFFIPGEIVQIAGGYVFGTFYGSMISVAGITIGSAGAFFLSNFLGKPFIEKITAQNNASKFRKFLKSDNAAAAIFFIYLIPGLPKDILAYLCGASGVSGKKFMIYSTLGRLPGIFISAYFGNKLTEGNILPLVVIAAIMTILFIIGTIKGEKILKNIIKKRSRKDS